MTPKSIVSLILLGGAVWAQQAPKKEAPPMTVARLYDNQLRSVENQIVPLVEAMPADKFGFKPTQGAFGNVRTFADQAKHVAAVLYTLGAGILQEKSPVDSGSDENGPATIQGKAQIVQYLKDAFAYAHKSLQTMTPANQLEMVPSPFGPRPTPRGSLASETIWHTFDHYGQMVVYLRMNNIVPPASQ